MLALQNAVDQSFTVSCLMMLNADPHSLSQVQISNHPKRRLGVTFSLYLPHTREPAGCCSCGSALLIQLQLHLICPSQKVMATLEAGPLSATWGHLLCRWSLVSSICSLCKLSNKNFSAFGRYSCRVQVACLPLRCLIHASSRRFSCTSESIFDSKGEGRSQWMRGGPFLFPPPLPHP